MHILCQGAVLVKWMSWAHGKFRETLKSMCDKKGKVMFNHPNLILAKHVHLVVG